MAPWGGFGEIVRLPDVETLEREQEVMMRRLWMTNLILVSLGCGEGHGGSAGSVSVRVDRPEFDATRAFKDLETQVAFGPRIPGSEGHTRQLVWLENRLLEFADTVFLDPFEHVTAQGHELSLTNVIARFGPDSGERLLLLTHWDTRPWADRSADEVDRDKPVPGANDGASGTAVLLELARMFDTQPPPGSVDLLFSDGEDYGPDTEDMFLGARHYVAGRAQEDPPAFAILLDMVGDVDPRFPAEAYSIESAPQVVQRVWGIAADLGYRRYFPMDETVRVLDDHVQLNDVGIPAIDVIDFDYGPNNQLWHTLDDTPENTSAQTLMMVGDVIAEVVYRNR